MRSLIPASVVGLALAACSSQPEGANDTLPANVTLEVPATAPSPTPPSKASPIPEPNSTATPAPGKTLALEGLGDLRIGEPVPRGSNWGSRGAQIPGDCRTISSPDFPDTYAIVIGGKVRRITVGAGSDVKLIEGIGVGSSEADVKKTFPSFRSEPHKYESNPAKYLTAPNGESGSPALRFEIGQNGKVSAIHVGTSPVLQYVEGCA